MHALLFSSPIAPMLASTISMSRASMISRSATSVGWLKKRRSGGTPVRPATLLRGASRRSATGLVARRRSSGSSERKNSAVWSRSGWSAQASADGGAEVVLGRAQQRVDVLEASAAALGAGGERDRADHRVVEVAAGGLEDLVLVDVQQRGDDVSAIAAASIGSGPSPGTRRGLMPNAGWPRSRNHTRLPQSGGVSRRHSRASRSREAPSSRPA